MGIVIFDLEMTLLRVLEVYLVFLEPTSDFFKKIRGAVYSNFQEAVNWLRNPR